MQQNRVMPMLSPSESSPPPDYSIAPDDDDEVDGLRAASPVSSSASAPADPASQHTVPLADAMTPSEHAAHSNLASPSAAKTWSDRNHEPRLLIEQSGIRIQERVAHKAAYFNLLQFIVFLTLYMLVLFLQSGGANDDARLLKKQLALSLFKPHNGQEQRWPDDQVDPADPTSPQYEIFQYSGDLYDTTNQRVESTVTDSGILLRWLVYDVLNSIFPESKPGRPADKSLDRFFPAGSTGNVVVIGPLVMQHRRAGSCVASDFFSIQVCSSSATDNSPFGVDPTFSPSSTLFADGVSASDFYSSDQIDPSTNLPYGFFSDMNCKSGCKIVGGYPVIFPRSASRTDISRLIRYLSDGRYVDDRTHKLSVELLLYNPTLNLFSSVAVTATVSIDGIDMVDVEQEIEILRTKKYTNLFWDRFRLTLEILYSMSLLGLIIREFVEVIDFARKYGKVAGFILYVSNFGNIVDWSSYVLQLLVIAAWVNIIILNNAFSPPLSPDAYLDLTRANNPLAAGPELGSAMAAYDTVQSLVRAQRLHATTAAISLVMACVQMLKNLDFHPRMGLVSRSISHAAVTLCFFFMLFFAVVIVFSLFGVVLYGANVDKFATIFVAMETMLEVLLGEFEQIKLVMGEVDAALTNFYFWTFMGIVYFILLNAFLAIIVEAYDNTKRNFDTISYVDPFASLLWSSFFFWLPGECGPLHISDENLLDLFEYVLGSNPNRPPLISLLPKLPASWGSPSASPLNDPPITFAVVLRKHIGDTFEDGTVDIRGNRIFFGERHLADALQSTATFGSKAISDPILAKVIARNVVKRFGLAADVDKDGSISNSEILALMVSARHGSATSGFASKAIAMRVQSLANAAHAVASENINNAGDRMVLFSTFADNVGGIGNMGEKLSRARRASAESLRFEALNGKLNLDQLKNTFNEALPVGVLGKSMRRGFQGAAPSSSGEEEGEKQP